MVKRPLEPLIIRSSRFGVRVGIATSISCCVAQHAAAERREGGVKGFEDFHSKDRTSFTRKPGPEFGPDCLICARFARQRLALRVDPAVIQVVGRGLESRVLGFGVRVQVFNFQDPVFGFECRIFGVGDRGRPERGLSSAGHTPRSNRPTP